MANALVDEVPDTDLVTEPHYNDASHWNSINGELQPSEWAEVQDLLKMKYSQDRKAVPAEKESILGQHCVSSLSSVPEMHSKASTKD